MEITMRDVHEAFGRVAESSQHYEFGLGVIGQYLEYFEKGWWHTAPSPDEATAFVKSIDKKTLGFLLKKVRTLCRFETDVSVDIDEILQDALSARNVLMHEFFLFSPENLEGPDGLRGKLAELQNHQVTIDKALGIASQLMEGLVRLRDDLNDPERREAIIEQGFKNLAAAGFANGSSKLN